MHKQLLSGFVLSAVVAVMIAACDAPTADTSNHKDNINQAKLDVRISDTKTWDLVSAKLSSTDVHQIREGIGLLALAEESTADNILNALWEGRAVNGLSIDRGIMKEPIVRTKIAQSIIARGNADPQYGDYLKSLIPNSNETVLIVATEGLRDIGDSESLDMLRELSNHPNPMIAEIAISGIRHQVDYGDNRDYALTVWKILEADQAVDQSLVNRYNQMYKSHKESLQESTTR